jgi:hypothetical protein
LGEAKLKQKRYATQKDMQELTNAVTELSKRILELSQWSAYGTIKTRPYLYDTATRAEILNSTKGAPLLMFLYRDLFSKNPLPKLEKEC